VTGALLVQYGGFLLALPRTNTVVRTLNWREYATVGAYVLASALASKLKNTNKRFVKRC